MSALVAAALAVACQNQVPLASAITTAHRTEEGIAWDTRYVVDVDAAFDFHGGRIPLAVPLPAGETLRETTGITAVMEDDRIAALCVEPVAMDGRTIRVAFTQPAVLGPNRAIKLGAPLAAGITVQIIDAHASEDLRVDAVRGGPLEPHVGFLAARGIGHDAREEARRLTNAPPLVGRTAIYVRGNDLRAAGGLDGKIGTRARERTTVIGAALAFITVAAGLLFAARKLKSAANVERADALLAGEIESCAASGASPRIPPPQTRAPRSAGSLRDRFRGPSLGPQR